MEALAEGVLLVDAGRPFAALATHWRRTPPIFVRHMMPVQVVAPLGGHAGDPTYLARVLPGKLPALDAAVSFSVQTRVLMEAPYKPFDINTALASALTGEAGPTLDVRAPLQVVSVVCAVLKRWQPAPQLIVGGSVGKGRRQVALAGVSLAANNLSNWAGGMRRFAREEGQISRAEFKLLEAIEVFGIEMPAHGVALDLGAAPGGWTRVLRRAGQYVTAIDPGDLDARLEGDAGVRHRRMTAEQYLQSDPDSFDIIVNDMRMDARDSARVMAAYAKLLYPHGWALMTVKLPEQNRQPVLDQTFAILRPAYIIVGARQLFHNRSEITLFLKPKRERSNTYGD
ncbi:MAG TPA: 50S rRNA methyltransferase [Chloroflexi bacterium]|nr:50S rRNA methyltransferase [Chloroflexota bacterium]HHW88352.1 50S rRNA methyltransferase [Chloroflexota bacterium]